MEFWLPRDWPLRRHLNDEKKVQTSKPALSSGHSQGLTRELTARPNFCLKFQLFFWNHLPSSPAQKMALHAAYFRLCRACNRGALPVTLSAATVRGNVNHHSSRHHSCFRHPSPLQGVRRRHSRRGSPTVVYRPAWSCQDKMKSGFLKLPGPLQQLESGLQSADLSRLATLSSCF